VKFFNSALSATARIVVSPFAGAFAKSPTSQRSFPGLICGRCGPAKNGPAKWSHSRGHSRVLKRRVARYLRSGYLRFANRG